MMTLPHFHLITHVLCPYVQRSIITLEEKSVAYTRTDIDLANKPAWFAEKSPLGKVPILIIDKQHSLFESTVICEYLDDATPGTLHPSGILEKAHHRAWIEFGSNILNKIASLYNAKSAEKFEHIHSDIRYQFQQIEEQLSNGPWFSGSNFHLIDAVYGPIFRYFDVFERLNIFERIAPMGTFDNLPKCTQWRNSLKQRHSIQRAVSNDYEENLIHFLIKRECYISQLAQRYSNI